MTRTYDRYESKSLPAAIREVRLQRRLRKQYEQLVARLDHERKLLAMLAADGPAFSNPLVAMEAKQLRDDILRRQCRLNPDGTPLA